jgi:hypothetical protein
MYLGCQWKELPIDKDGEGHPETHYTRIYRIWRRWVDNSCMDTILAGSASRLHEDGRLDTTVRCARNDTIAAGDRGASAHFAALYRIEATTHGQVPDVRLATRAAKSAPLCC